MNNFFKLFSQARPTTIEAPNSGGLSNPLEKISNTANQKVGSTGGIAGFLETLVYWLGIFGLVVLVTLLLVALAYLVRFFIRRYLNLTRFKNLSFIQVIIPETTFEKSQKDGSAKKDDKDTVGAGEQIFRVLQGYSGNAFSNFFTGGQSFSFEIVNKKGKINFWIAGPKNLIRALEKQLVAVYPRCMISEIEDPSITKPGSFSYAQEFTTSNIQFLPFKTYKGMDTDPLNIITNAMSGVAENDTLSFQLLVRPLASKWQKKPRALALQIQQGQNPEDILNPTFVIPKAIGRFLRSFFEKKKKDEDHKDELGERNIDYSGLKTAISLTPQQQEIVKKLEEKASHPGYLFNLRVLACSTDEQEAVRMVQNFLPTLQTFDIRPFNFFEESKRNAKDIINDYLTRSLCYTSTKIINTEEATSLWHLPNHLVTNSSINYLTSYKAPLPLNLLSNSPTNIFVGKGKSGTLEKDVYLSQEDRFRHIYALGGSGSGKSVFMTNLVLQDIEKGNGLCVIDPHGETVDDVLLRMPKHRIDDVIVFSPSMVDKPLGLNMLEYDPLKPAQRTVVIDTLFQIWDKLYDLKSTGGPMFEQYMKNAMKLVMSHPESGNTLLEISKVLSDQGYRSFKLAMCQEQEVIDFWTKEAEKAGGEASLENMVPYITSKLAPFVQNDFIRPMIGQAKSAINFRMAMDNKKIILVKLEKGLIGETSGYLLGMVIIGQILLAGMGRNDGLKYNEDGTTSEISSNERQAFFVYIDEMQNFLFDAIPKALEEIRKYKIGFTLAHQFIKQVVSKGDERIKDSIMANTGSKFIFRCSSEDADYLIKEFEPTLTPSDLMNPERFTANTRILINGDKTKPFNIAPVELSHDTDKDLRKLLLDLTKEKYGKDLETIKAEIKDRQEKFLF
jgi:flagellar basal body-associated protein FliL